MIEMFLMSHIYLVVAIVASMGFAIGYLIALFKGFKAGMGYGVDMTMENIRLVMERKGMKKIFENVVKDIGTPEDINMIDLTVNKYL